MCLSLDHAPLLGYAISTKFYLFLKLGMKWMLGSAIKKDNRQAAVLKIHCQLSATPVSISSLHFKGYTPAATFPRSPHSQNADIISSQERLFCDMWMAEEQQSYYSPLAAAGRLADNCSHKEFGGFQVFCELLTTAGSRDNWRWRSMIPVIPKYQWLFSLTFPSPNFLIVLQALILGTKPPPPFFSFLKYLEE